MCAVWEERYGYYFDWSLALKIVVNWQFLDGDFDFLKLLCGDARNKGCGGDARNKGCGGDARNKGCGGDARNKGCGGDVTGTRRWFGRYEILWWRLVGDLGCLIKIVIW
ncbi:hypothetical protein Pmani_008023 [Petrolisthes manimaculis]|uniref:Uncharacterized protein n=1 Tax=Petrolisthes manimaculis TaxID=1843537 RepID=A0AAE1Q7R1_9EUCA|nr:hypothetical protein Pmani_008023 [Petrolisthes manimaculis]